MIKSNFWQQHNRNTNYSISDRDQLDTYFLSFFFLVRSVIATWFNYGTDPVMLREQNAEKNRFTIDTCLIMRFEWKAKNNGTVHRLSYPWYQHQRCSDPKGHKHSFICEYEGECNADSSFSFLCKCNLCNNCKWLRDKL